MLQATISMLTCILVFFGATPRAKSRPETFPTPSSIILFDFGIVLGIVLVIGSAIEVILQSISAWFRRTSSAKLTITDKKGEVLISNIDPLDTKKLIESLQDARNR